MKVLLLTSLLTSLLINIWFAGTIIKLENFQYATQLEIQGTSSKCGLYDEEIRRSAVGVCLQKRQMRSSFSNLLYGLEIL